MEYSDGWSEQQQISDEVSATSLAIMSVFPLEFKNCLERDIIKVYHFQSYGRFLPSQIRYFRNYNFFKILNPL